MVAIPVQGELDVKRVPTMVLFFVAFGIMLAATPLALAADTPAQVLLIGKIKSVSFVESLGEKRSTDSQIWFGDLYAVEIRPSRIIYGSLGTRKLLNVKVTAVHEESISIGKEIVILLEMHGGDDPVAIYWGEQALIFCVPPDLTKEAVLVNKFKAYIRFDGAQCISTDAYQ